MTTELKPCPFCAGEVWLHEPEGMEDPWWWVGCKKCGIKMPNRNQDYKAIVQWNTRPDGGDSLREAVKDVLEWDGGLHSLGYDGTKAVKARDFLKKWLNSALAAKDGG